MSDLSMCLFLSLKTIDGIFMGKSTINNNKQLLENNNNSSDSKKVANELKLCDSRLWLCQGFPHYLSGAAYPSLCSTPSDPRLPKLELGTIYDP